MKGESGEGFASSQARPQSTADMDLESTSPPREVNLAETRRYLEILDPDAEAFTFQVFDDRKPATLRPKILHGRFDDLCATLVELNAKGYGVFVCINQTDLKGRKAENIVRQRACWQDDDAGAGWTLRVEPHITVQTSPGKFQRVFLVDGLNREQFTVAMDRMVELGCDQNARDLARVLRLPGFWHQKGEPYRSRLISESGAQPYQAEAFLRLIGVRRIAETGETRADEENARPEDLLTARRLAFGMAERTRSDPSLSRHLAVYQLGCWLRRDGIEWSQALADEVLKVFEANMRPTDTGGRTCGMDHQSCAKALADGYHRPSKPDRRPPDNDSEAGAANQPGGDRKPTGDLDDEENEAEEEEETLPPADGTKLRDAIVSARRGALRGDTSNEIIRRIIKQWPEFRAHAPDLEAKARVWAEKLKPGMRVKVHDVVKRVTTLEELNKDYALLVAPRTASCIIKRSDGLPITDKDFNARIAGLVLVVGVHKDGQPRYLDAAKAWRSSAEKHCYQRIVFTGESVPEDVFNLFPGFGVEPKSGTCDRILRHLREVICDDDAEAYEALLNLIAWQLQNVGTPSRIIVILTSLEQQIGKGLFVEHVLCKLAGAAGFLTNDIKHLTAQFNDMFRGKVIIILDEAMFSGDRRAADKLKCLATMTRLAVEGKWLPVIDTPVGLNFWLVSNHQTPAYVEEHDLRYWPLVVSPRYLGDYGYFAELVAEINNGGVEAFAHQMLTRDVSAFYPQRDVPCHNAHHSQMVNDCLEPGDVRNWLAECVASGMLIGIANLDRTAEIHQLPWLDWPNGGEIRAGLLLQGYKQWLKNLRDPRGVKATPMRDFWQTLSSVGFTSTGQSPTGNRGRMRQVPSIDEVAELLAAGPGSTASEP